LEKNIKSGKKGDGKEKEYVKETGRTNAKMGTGNIRE
jgi:hypothetical protein